MPQPALRKVTQVAVVALRAGDTSLDVCLIRRKGSSAWKVPKGFIDRGDTPEQAAATEAYEEAGIRGEITGPPLGTYDYDKWSATQRVAVYVMVVSTVLVRWPESGFRERTWMPLDEARTALASHPVHALWPGVEAAIRNAGG